MEDCSCQSQDLGELWLPDDTETPAVEASEAHLPESFMTPGSPSDVFRNLLVLGGSESIVGPEAVGWQDSMVGFTDSDPSRFSMDTEPGTVSAIGKWSALFAYHWDRQPDIL